MSSRFIYIVILIIFLFLFLFFINTKEGLELQRQSLGCYENYEIKDISSITMERALHAKGILYNPDLDATFKTRLLKAMRLTEREDPFLYNLLYDSGKLPGPKIREVTDIIDKYFVKCT
jgi:hypothetical protein